jgi:signal transduction histidine kinase
MTYRSRLLLGFAAATVLPLLLAAVGVRRQLSLRLEAQHQRRVDALAHVATQDLERESASVAARLHTLARELEDDNHFRLAVRGAPEERSYLLDYAERAMLVTGLSMLQVQDQAGRILSSGHFRNEFDRLDPDLPHLLGASGDRPTLVSTRGPDGQFIALARIDSLRLGGAWFTIIGGTRVDRAFLDRFARDGELSITLVAPDGNAVRDPAEVLRPDDTDDGAIAPRSTNDDSDERVVAKVALAFIDTRTTDSARVGTASLVISHSLGELEALRHDVDRWLLATAAMAVLAALSLGAWLSAGLSRPLAELSHATSALHLEGPEVVLAAGRDDEIGALARRFTAMSRRLRASAARLRAAERRATVGEMARQVNHDIKNGLIPIRNVLRHLSQVQERHPEELPVVFAERRGTLESGLGYLDALARNYARLTPAIERRPFEVNAVARAVVGDTVAGNGLRVEMTLAEALPPVIGDPVVLHRILDNLLRNAIESLPSERGRVVLETCRDGAGTVSITVSDTGRGMDAAELARAFDDFFTTKPTGTGLGLSVVRRLTSDLGGSLRVVSTPGKGTTVTLTLLAAGASGKSL